MKTWFMVVELPTALLRSLTTAQVRLFAARFGWSSRTAKRGGPVLNHPTDGLTQIHLPNSDSDPDYAFRMRDAVIKLASSEKREPAALLHDLLLPAADILHIRLRSHDAANGTLPIDLGVKLFQAGQQVLTYAACSAQEPRAFYRTTTAGRVPQFMDRCLMGQSRNGNGYTATFAAPVTPDLQKTFADLPPTDDATANEVESLAVSAAPFERQVTLTLMRAVHTLKTAFEQGDTSGMAKHTDQGISANLCDALAELSVADQRAEVDIGVGWSKALPIVPFRLRNGVTFAQPEIVLLSAVGKELKRIEQRRQPVVGPITGLHAKPAELFDPFQGEVTVSAVVNGQKRSVRFTLPEAEYKQACDAHRDRLLVSVSGIPTGEASSSIFRLTLPKGFKVVAPSAQPEGVPSGS